MMANALLVISVGIELGVFILMLLASLRKNSALFGLAAAFGLFILYDGSKLLELPIPSVMLDLIFILAAWAALWSAWQLYRGPLVGTPPLTLLTPDSGGAASSPARQAEPTAPFLSPSRYSPPSPSFSSKARPQHKKKRKK
jgi:hypothetical protein